MLIITVYYLLHYTNEKSRVICIYIFFYASQVYQVGIKIFPIFESCIFYCFMILPDIFPDFSSTLEENILNRCAAFV